MKDKVWINIALFIATFYTVTVAGMYHYNIHSGVSFPGGGIIIPSDKKLWVSGLYFSIPFITILTAHEFGHYITARLYRLKVSLPYFIPIYFPPGLAPISIGTFGAIIRQKSRPITNKQFFDIGIAGPLAGFFVALLFIIFGLYNLPPKDEIYKIHPNYKTEYEDRGVAYDDPNNGFYAENTKKYEQPVNFAIGSNLMMEILINIFVDDPRSVPNPMEFYHFPFLFSGFFRATIYCH